MATKNSGKMRVSNLRVWKEITVYPANSKHCVTAGQLTRAGFHVEGGARDMMSQPEYKTLTKPRKLKLVRLKIRDLGFNESELVYRIRERIEEAGGELCPPELGPKLRKEFSDQPIGDHFLLAMKQIVDSDGNSRVFVVANHMVNELWLQTAWGANYDEWHPNSKIVFVLRE
jgi:hypothetical protein